MERTQYDQKVLQFLASSGATQIRSPFTSYNNEIRVAINTAEYILPEKPSSLLQMNSSLPKIYGQVKLHNEGLPIRPVVAFFTDPSFKLAKQLSTWFCGVSGFTPKYTVKNSAQLTAKLCDTKFPAGSKLVMFTKIPVSRAIPLMIEILEQMKIDSH